MAWTQGYGDMTRTNIEWSIEGRKGTRSGKLYQLHEMELMGAKESIKRLARRGDTVTIKEV
jgi:hypothetical protein